MSELRISSGLGSRDNDLSRNFMMNHERALTCSVAFDFSLLFGSRRPRDCPIAIFLLGRLPAQGRARSCTYLNFCFTFETRREKKKTRGSIIAVNFTVLPSYKYLRDTDIYIQYLITGR